MMDQRDEDVLEDIWRGY